MGWNETVSAHSEAAVAGGDGVLSSVEVSVHSEGVTLPIAPQFVYEVQRIDCTQPPKIYPFISIEVNRPVAAPDVMLIKYPFGGFFAN